MSERTKVEGKKGVYFIDHRGDPERKAPWGVHIDATITRGKPRLRSSKFYVTEAEGRRAYAAACDEIEKLRAEAEQDARRRKALEVPELPPAPTGVTLFETLALRWMKEHVKEMREPATYRNYDGLLTRHLLPIMRTWPVTDEVMSPQRLKDVLKRQLFAKGARLRTRLACQRCLSAFFGWAIGELPPGQLVRNPVKEQARYIRDVSEKDVELTQEPNPMTETQVEAFLVWQKEHYPELYDLFLWLVDEGSRIGEACALQWDKIELARGRAHIARAYSSSKRWMQRKNGDEDGNGEQGTKTHRQNQWIDLSSRVSEMLPTRKAANREQWMAVGRPGKEPRHAFLTSRLTPRRPDKTVYGPFREACDALGLVGQTGKKFTIHCLRDTFATLAILSGKPIGWVSLMLGHKDEQTTRTHYYKWVRLVEENPLAQQK